MARNESELAAATAALDAELQRFEDATETFARLSLNSQKNLERATRSLNELADGEQRVGEQVQALVKAISTVRDRQLAQVEVIRAKAEEIKARSGVFQALQEELRALGEGAAALTARLQQAAQGQPLGDLEEVLGALAAKARSLQESASAQDFDDLSRLADGLRQQILAVRAKVKLITKPSASA